MALLCERYVFLGGRRNGLVLEICAAMAVFWVIWMDRNIGSFQEWGEAGLCGWNPIVGFSFLRI